MFTISLDCLPRSALEALLIPLWKAAMLEEFLALLRNRTWILTSLPSGKNLIGNTWIFRLKRHADGSIARHKSRLVAQGFSQEPGFDFTETFSPVVKPTTIRLILSIAVTCGWEISHLDVNNAFLHGDLNEEIYMRQPVGFEQGDPSLVCKLNKALYELKQASRSWFLTIQSVLLSLGFQQSRADTSLFFRIRGKEVIYLLIYVDDMLVTGSSSTAIKKIISKLSDHFSLKDLGEVKHFLGVEVTHTAQGLHLCQAAYIKELLNKVQMQDCKPYPTPMLNNLKLSKNDGDPFMDGKLYRSTVGALQYATITRPEISFCVNKVSQFMASPLDTHWKAVKRILRYLAGSIDYGLHVQRSESVLTAFSDSDWAADLDDRRSVTGYCVYFGKNLVSWSSKKQTVVSRSSTEAEYRSLAQTVCEVSWIASLLDELKVNYARTPVVWVDNMSTIALASNPVLHARTKHIEIDVHFVRDKVRDKMVELRYVPTTDQIADLMTKALGYQFFSRLRNKLGICSLPGIELRGSVNVVIKTPPCNNHTTDGVKEKRMSCNVMEPRVSVPTWKDVLLSGMPSLVKS